MFIFISDLLNASENRKKLQTLEEENKALLVQNERLEDENDSLWSLLDEIKRSEQEIMTMQALQGLKPIGEA